MTTKAKPGTALSDGLENDGQRDRRRETVVCDIETHFAMYSTSPQAVHIYMMAIA